jgi:hypothetical protein
MMPSRFMARPRAEMHSIASAHRGHEVAMALLKLESWKVTHELFLLPPLRVLPNQ